MDRFIEQTTARCSVCGNDLKSNMDRFIEPILSNDFQNKSYLKSNMDRFIGNIWKHIQGINII